MLCALTVAGCSYQLDSLLSKNDAGVNQTGFVSRPPVVPAGAATATPAEADLVYARAAASDALSRAGKDGSVPWQNPQTGAGGNITPLAASHDEGGMPCRDFLASYLRGTSQTWLQGAACRTSQGKWEVTSLKPFRQS